MAASDFDHFTPDAMDLIRGEAPRGLEALENVAEALGILATHNAAILPMLHEKLGLASFDINISEPTEELSGTITLSDIGGEVGVALVGKLGSELPAFRGTPFISSKTGTFKRMGNEERPFDAEDNTKVIKGQQVGWWFVTKGVEGPIMSPATGIIHFAVEHQGEIKMSETVILYIEEKK